jgi:hypothetical protein
VHLDVDESADEGRAGAGDFDAGAAQGGEEAGEGGLFGQAEGKRFELPVEWGGGVVAGAGDAPPLLLRFLCSLDYERPPERVCC